MVGFDKTYATMTYEKCILSSRALDEDFTSWLNYHLGNGWTFINIRAPHQTPMYPIETPCRSLLYIDAINGLFKK